MRKQVKRTINTEIIENLKLEQEDQLIINFLRSEYDRETKFDGFSLLNIDWDIVYKKSSQLGVAPLLYKIIKKCLIGSQLSCIPEDFLQKIKIAYLRTFIINEKNFDKLTELINLFSSAGIKVILLKGSHLAQFVYKDLGLRQMHDIDIMIKREDLKKAENLLIQTGYYYSTYSHDAEVQDYLRRKFYTQNHHLLPFCHPQDIILEVHWTIIRPSVLFNIDIEGLWERAQEKKIHNTTVSVLCVEDLLLHLSLHASYSGRAIPDLKPYCDIAKIITSYADNIKWDQLQIRARRWKTEKSLYLTLSLAKEFFGLILPDNFLYTLCPEPFDKNILFEAQKRIFACKVNEAAIRLPTSEIFYSDINISKKLFIFFQKIFVPSKELASRYALPASSKRIYLYYFVHFWSLLYKNFSLYATLMLHLAIHKKKFCSSNMDAWLFSSGSIRNKK